MTDPSISSAIDLPSLESVSQAAVRLKNVANVTPVLTSRTLNTLTGATLFLKGENFQRAGAFKFRGAYNALSQLTTAEREVGVVTFSSGNHAQGLALAGKLLDVPVTVVMPRDAPENKRQATIGYGATVVGCEAIHREEVAAKLITQHNYTFIHPYDNSNIIAGQGTAALELFQEVGPLDLLFVPVGGGGLISGSALAAQLVSPRCRIIGVEPAMAADAGESWRNGEIFTLDYVPGTVADGLRTRYIGERNLKIMRDFVDQMVTVSEKTILKTLRFIWTRLGIIVEPSAAVALAPLFTREYHLEPDSKVGVLLSGGNIDLTTMARLALAESLKDSVTADNIPVVTDNEPKTGIPQVTEGPRILSLIPLPHAAAAELPASSELVTIDTLDEEHLLSEISHYEALIIGSEQGISGRVLKYGAGLKAIGVLGTHADNVGVSAARAMGIEVITAPSDRSVAIAEHTIGRLLNLSQRFSDGILSGKTLGIIGFGSVGDLVADRARAFDMQIIVNQPRLTTELALADDIVAVDLVDLLQNADYVSLHVPYRPENETLLGADQLSQMKPNSMLINSGHTDLVDEVALLAALESQEVTAASLSELPPEITKPSPESFILRSHNQVLVEPHVIDIIGEQQERAALQVVRRIKEVLNASRNRSPLDLEIVSITKVAPHEHIDQKRVDRLKVRLAQDDVLANPPVTTLWKGQYVILDGATRFSALSQLGYPHIAVQVIKPELNDVELHTWYHAISAEKGGLGDYDQLLEGLRTIEGLLITSLKADEVRVALDDPSTISYLLARSGRTTLLQIAPDAPKLAVTNAVVDYYNKWGRVERTLLTDRERLAAQFPNLVAVSVFPQFKPDEVFDAAADGNLLPAGLTRFVIPGRILRLNLELSLLKSDDLLSQKQTRFEKFLESKLARSRMRHYYEPVILLDE